MTAEARKWLRHVDPRAVAGVFCIVCCFTCSLGEAKSIGNAIVIVRGPVREIVLVDPQGRTDRYDDTASTSRIPGCWRAAGEGEGEDMADTIAAGPADTVATSFELSKVLYGRYIVQARAAGRVKVTITVTFDPEGSGAPACVGLKRTDQIAAGRHGWAIDFRRSPPKGECTARLAPLVQRER